MSEPVRRMLVAQFEGFLDDNDERYIYPLPDPVEMGGESWGSWVFGYSLADGSAPETTDTVKVMERHGLALENDLVMARYARIVEPEARHEVLLFYTEPLGRLGHSLESASVEGELRLLADLLAALDAPGAGARDAVEVIDRPCKAQRVVGKVRIRGDDVRKGDGRRPAGAPRAKTDADLVV